MRIKTGNRKESDLKMNNLKFLEIVDGNILKSENKIYRGAIPWFLLCSDEKKIVYVSTSNRNLENYYSMLEGYSGSMEKSLSIFENTSSNKEDLTGINIELLNILKNRQEFILFLNLQITLDVFFEKVNLLYFKIGESYKFSDIIGFLTKNGMDSPTFTSPIDGFTKVLKGKKPATCTKIFP